MAYKNIDFILIFLIILKIKAVSLHNQDYLVLHEDNFKAQLLEVNNVKVLISNYLILKPLLLKKYQKKLLRKDKELRIFLIKLNKLRNNYN